MEFENAIENAPKDSIVYVLSHLDKSDVIGYVTPNNISDYHCDNEEDWEDVANTIYLNWFSDMEKGWFISDFDLT